jgi:two-component system, cell cycle response regulator DivK
LLVLPAALRQLQECGETTLVEELIVIFESDTAERLEVLARAVETADYATARQEAHTIKGSALQVGAAPFAEACRQMEMEARKEAPSDLAVLTAPCSKGSTRFAAPLPRAAGSSRMAPRTMANETILVVDDAPVSLKLTDLLLRKEGYQVHATTDAEQALSMLHSLHPDLMLVDIQLPGMSGLELTRRIKQDSRTRDIVVVALTACAMKGDDDVAFKAGCDGYITKPIETLTLANKVREYLEKRIPPREPEEPQAPEEPGVFPAASPCPPPNWRVCAGASWKRAFSNAGRCSRTSDASSIFLTPFGRSAAGWKPPGRWTIRCWPVWRATPKNCCARPNPDRQLRCATRFPT